MFAFAVESDPSLESVSDATKDEIAISAIRQLVVGSRRASLAELKEGFEAVVGPDRLAAMLPAELAFRMLGWEPQPSGIECVFDEEDWEDPDLRSTYATWLAEWSSSLSSVQRCALRMLVAGSCAPVIQGARASITTSVMCSDMGAVCFLPEAAQLYMPVVSSAAELFEKMDAALA